MKVWISKYALTSGIKECDVRDCGDGMVADGNRASVFFYHGEGCEWHRSKEAALSRAREMRFVKIVSLKKQIAKLEAMDFSK